MFHISIKQDDYLNYILEDRENNSRMEVVPEKGGIITAWKLNGQDIFYLDKERFKNPQLSVRGGNPILFPICGNLPDNLFLYEGKEYQLKQHGFARDLPWEVISQSTDEAAQIVLRLSSNEETLLIYPFEFELTFTYQLVANRLIITQEYYNKSNQIMPFSVGFHPYFWCQDKSSLSLDIPASEYSNKTGEKTFPFAGNLDYDQDEIDIAFRTITKDTASFVNYKRNMKVSLKYSNLFSTLVFWTLKGKDYICLEPWSAPRNALNTGEKTTYLKPSQGCRGYFEIIVSNT
ncbi:aldose epimerase [Cyanobacterium stanieri LEGE 03274]|uniref:Aldose epimerase n=1 Tax=Cyanobacterium stanieri LEGE 03274 TaxID=1828756 RepID=A0ABR9V7P4_9CHRO|nr:aldose epimerase [Cyanobacterium stanieri]MBE9222844.1 aldose epimerase [Cyanobacterium stanieri LEGE 03274]